MVAVAVIPARSGSKSILDKNLQKVGGLSLLERATHISIASGLFDRVLVLTDSIEYAKIAEGSGADAPYLRSNATSGDLATDFEVFLELTNRLQLDDCTTLAHIRPTTPLREVAVMAAALEEFGKRIGRISSLRSVHEMSESAYKSFERLEDGKLLPIGGQSLEGQNLPRQFFPKTFVANGYIDLFQVSQIRAGSLHGENIFGFETNPVLEIDSPQDLDLVRLQVGMLEG